MAIYMMSGLDNNLVEICVFSMRVMEAVKVHVLLFFVRRIPIS